MIYVRHMQVWNMYRTFALVFAFLALPGPSCINSDNIGLLAGTLKTMQRAACDDEMVSLACPRGTSISIQVAQYGKAANSRSCTAESGVAVEVVGEEKCLRPNSMQYSLLQTVVEACQKKPKCKFSTKPKPGLVDPCPFARKFVEVAYKCRPYEFRSRTGCEDDVIKLSCNPHSRIAIFDAQYGRIAYDSPVTCPQRQGVPDETCMDQYAPKTVMQICHGQRRCQITANNKTFGSPCSPYTRIYLKIIYACVPLGVLTEKYESAAEDDEILNGFNDHDDAGLFDESEGAGERWGEPPAVPPIANPALQLPPEEVNTLPPVMNNEQSTIHIVPKENFGEHTESSQSKTQLFIYIGVGVLVFVILIILLIGVRCYIIRRSSRHPKTSDMFTTDTPNVFNDAVSDIDNDIDVSHISGTFYEHPDMILYRDVPGNKGTLRAMRPLSTIYPCAGASMYGNVDYVPTHSRDIETSRFRAKEDMDIDPEVLVSPRSLGRSQNQFYYG